MRIPVTLAASPYDVVVARGALRAVADEIAQIGGVERAVVVSQAPVAAHYVEVVTAILGDAGAEPTVVEIPDGEGAKSLNTLADLYDRCAALPLRRHDVVIALGGGVVGDVAGFLAATWNRGVDVVQVPTTLLAQVDAAIGGKTGINLAAGKNLVGAFHQPAVVIADIDTLATLPPRVRTEGLGEVVKYGLIRDPTILDLVEANSQRARDGDLDLLEELVIRSVRVKAQVVAADEREAGERAHLNFGHTFGHAVEALTGYAHVLHGEAVAIGMLVALDIGVRLGVTAPDLQDRARGLLDRLGLPTAAPRLDRGAVWETMARDKKARGGVRWVLVRQPGDVVVVLAPPDVVDDALDNFPPL